MSRKLACVLALGFAAAAGGTARAQAQVPIIDRYQVTSPDVVLPARCDFSEPARMITTMREVPGLAQEFQRRKIDIADTGEPFIPFDVSERDLLPHRQFLRAYKFEKRTIVWYYHGGRGTHIHVVDVQTRHGPSGDEPALQIVGANLSGPLCETTQAILIGIHGFDSRASEW